MKSLLAVQSINKKLFFSGNQRRMNYKQIIDIFVLCVILAIAAYSLSLISPPESVSQDSPKSAFSAERAMKHVNVISQKPHAVGTQQNTRVRNYIIGELARLQLKPELQKTSVIHYFGDLRVGYVHNILGVLKGKEPGQALCLAAHYDSQPNTGGAGDDASGVAAILEAARALRYSGGLKNDLYFLFTDSEETGLLGAKAFVEQHPAAKNIALVINLEARGNRGVSITLEQSPQNGWIMREYAKIVPYPFAASFINEVYKHFPINTDFNIFRQAGFSGFNIAFLDGFVNYHSLADSPQHLDKKSLQHHGSYIMSMTKHFANLNLNRTREADAVFFNPIGSWLVVFPQSVLFITAIIVIVLFTLYIYVGMKKKRLSITGAIGGAILNLITITAILFLVGYLWEMIISLYPYYKRYYAGNFYNISYYFAGWIAITVALFARVQSAIFAKTNLENNAAGALLIGILVMLAMLIEATMASYLLIYPLFFIIITRLIGFFLGLSEDTGPIVYKVIILAGLIPVILLYVPTIKLLYFIMALKIIQGTNIVVLLLLGFMISPIKWLDNINKRFLPMTALLTGIICFILAHLNSGYDKQKPLQSNLMYCVDADSKKALWVSKHLKTDEWNDEFFTKPEKALLKNIRPDSYKIRLINQAPYLSFSKPQIQIVRDDIFTGKRILTLSISTQRKANIMELLIDRKAELISVTIDGKPVTDSRFYQINQDFHRISFYGFVHKNINMTIEYKNNAPLRMIIIDKKNGLPSFKGIKPMPAWIIPDTGWDSNITLVKKTFVCPKRVLKN